MTKVFVNDELEKVYESLETLNNQSESSGYRDGRLGMSKKLKGVTRLSERKGG